jgi:hypothetical protein
MTEAEWLTCSDPDRMLEHLGGNASERKLRLLCSACCRRHWHLLEAARLREAVDALERFVDGEMDEGSFRAAASDTHPYLVYRDEFCSGQPRQEILWSAYAITQAVYGCLVRLGEWVHPRPPMEDTSKTLEFFAYAAGAAGKTSPPLFPSGEERAAQADLIRELFGDTRRPASLPSAYLSWSDSISVKLAVAIYEDRALPEGTLDSSRLPILADALEEAGCEDEQLLTHLRSPGPHVRGCWALDLILGKE